MRKSMSLVVLAAASLSLGGMDSCLAQGASDANPNAAPAKMHKQKMSNGGSGAATAKPSYSHRAMRKRLKKSHPQSKPPQSQRPQPVAKR